MPKTALVTGSAGFIGRHMVRELESRGYDVAGCDISPYSYDALDFFKESSHVYDLVVHAAYHVGGREGIDGRNMNFVKNVQLDASLFEWAVRTGQKRVLYFSSCAAYPKHLMSDHRNGFIYRKPNAPIKEEQIIPGHISEPFDNYGHAKLMGERMAEDARANGLNVSVVRPFSGYGEDQSADYPFRAILDRARNGDLSVWGPPGQTRDWIHVSDVINGALAVVESETTDPVNLCTGVATEMGDLARMVYAAHNSIPDYAGPTSAEVEYLADKPTGAFYRVGDPTRLKEYYTPKVSLQEGIRRALQK